MTKNTTYKNTPYIAKEMVRGKYKALVSYKRRKISQQ